MRALFERDAKRLLDVLGVEETVVNLATAVIVGFARRRRSVRWVGWHFLDEYPTVQQPERVQDCGRDVHAIKVQHPEHDAWQCRADGHAGRGQQIDDAEPESFELFLSNDRFVFV